MTAYQILDWDENFENHKSRTINQCSFVCIPNKQDGLGLARVLSQPDGPAIFGLWVLMVEACSQQRLPRDGWLTVDGHPEGTAWTSDDLALKWRRSPEEIQRALDVLSSPAVGWIKAPAECPSGVLAVPVQYPHSVQKEGRNEQKGMKEDTPAANAAALFPLEEIKKPKAKKTPFNFSDVSPEFREFWKHMPNQEDPANAWKNWQALLKKVDVAPADLIQAAKNYEADCRAKGQTEKFFKASNFVGKFAYYENYLPSVHKAASAASKPVSQTPFADPAAWKEYL